MGFKKKCLKIPGKLKACPVILWQLTAKDISKQSKRIADYFYEVRLSPEMCNVIMLHHPLVIVSHIQSLFLILLNLCSQKWWQNSK